MTGIAGVAWECHLVDRSVDLFGKARPGRDYHRYFFDRHPEEP
jgi:hypothetical protein